MPKKFLPNEKNGEKWENLGKLEKRVKMRKNEEIWGKLGYSGEKW